MNIVTENNESKPQVSIKNYEVVITWGNGISFIAQISARSQFNLVTIGKTQAMLAGFDVQNHVSKIEVWEFLSSDNKRRVKLVNKEQLS